ncbi:hypothetical protein I3760_06G030500 [Carya illinoinensis]|nr:hypothetical protein I3760_06G030500 [Carya illinoinensis]
MKFERERERVKTRESQKLRHASSSSCSSSPEFDPSCLQGSASFVRERNQRLGVDLLCRVELLLASISMKVELGKPPSPMDTTFFLTNLCCFCAFNFFPHHCLKDPNSYHYFFNFLLRNDCWISLFRPFFLLWAFLIPKNILLFTLVYIHVGP